MVKNIVTNCRCVVAWQASKLVLDWSLKQLKATKLASYSRLPNLIRKEEEAISSYAHNCVVSREDAHRRQKLTHTRNTYTDRYTQMPHSCLFSSDLPRHHTSRQDTDGGHLIENSFSRPLDPIFFRDPVVLQSICYRTESIPTDKREQYDWRAEKNLDGQFIRGCFIAAKTP